MPKKNDFSQEEQRSWQQCQSLYDIAAWYYDAILARKVHEISFVAQYMDMGAAGGVTNPNLKLLHTFRVWVWDRVRQNLWLTDAQKQELWNQMETVLQQLQPFGQETENQASVFMAAIQALDLVVDERKAAGYRFSSRGPLNNPDNANSLVYLKKPEPLQTALADACRFRTPVEPVNISSVLKILTFLKKADCFPECGYPQIKQLPVHEGRKRVYRNLKNTRSVKAAVFPDSVPKPFEFDTESTAGSSFRVDYSKDSAAKEADKYCNWIRFAVQAGAHFIIFPEFYMQPDTLRQIQEWMRSQKKERWMKNSSLLAVFAGSSWEKDDNNVMHILDWCGEELGCYYKYSPFVSLPSAAGSERLVQMCERLTAPGKKSMLLDIDIVGRCLPAICRDVIDGRYTEHLVQNFQPFLLFVSAYSPSVASFKRHFSHYSSWVYTTCVLCNACDAVQKKSSLGLCSVPQKKSTEMSSQIKEIRKCNQETASCPDSCCIFLQLDYQIPSGSIPEKIGPRISAKHMKMSGSSFENGLQNA